MGVLSKALRFGVLVVANFCLLSGCAYGPSTPVMSGAPVVTGSDEAVSQSAATDQTAGLIENNSLDHHSDGGVIPELPEQRARSSASKMALLSLAEEGIGLNLVSRTGQSKYLIETRRPDFSFEIVRLKNPARIVVDVLGEAGSLTRHVGVDGQFVSAVRVGAHPNKTRLVFDVNSSSNDLDIEHRVDRASGSVEVAFTDAGVLARASEVEVVVPPQMIQAQLGKPAVDEQVAKIDYRHEESIDTIRREADLEAVVPVVPEVDVKGEIKEESIVAAPVEDRNELAALPNGEVLLDGMEFVKGSQTSGAVSLRLTDVAPFELSQTAPSEYVLKIAGVNAAERTQIPQIAPVGFPGIRSARAVQNKEIVEVRMFVDPGVLVEAEPRGKEILVTAQSGTIAGQPGARAQIGQIEEAIPAPGTEEGDELARANPTGVKAADGSKIYTGRLISLDLQDTDIDNALRIIAEVSNLNIIASDDVAGKVTLRLIDVPWDQALDVILKTNGLDQVTEGNVIRIAPVDKLRQEREALREARRAQENLEELSVRYVRVSYARVAELQEQVAAVLTERGTVTVDERTNQLIIKDISKGQEESLKLIKRLDLRTPQVLLETQIVEGSRNILRDLGFQWNFNLVQSPETGNATGYNFPNTVQLGGSGAGAGDFNAVEFPAAVEGGDGGTAISLLLDSADGSRFVSARLSALEQDGRVQVISRPQISTINNKQAEIKSVETLRVRLPSSGTSVATGQGAQVDGGAGAAFEEIDVGITLRVTPQASPDYFVLMDIQAVSSTLGANQVEGIPSTLEREATSTILVKSGQTFALGGIYRLDDQDTITGVPWVKDIPFIGHFFRRSFVNKRDEELIFFITPHIVEGSFDPSLT